MYIYIYEIQNKDIEDMIPVHMRPSLWFRFKEDIFFCFKDISLFDTFLECLNSIQPMIQFTFEPSRTERKIEGQPDLPTDIVESLPFLELEIMYKSIHIYMVDSHEFCPLVVLLFFKDQLFYSSFKAFAI